MGWFENWFIILWFECWFCCRNDPFLCHVFRVVKWLQRAINRIEFVVIVIVLRIVVVIQTFLVLFFVRLVVVLALLRDGLPSFFVIVKKW